jgi:polysaccharide pyruvyl transferase WcaK-like protein
MRNGHPTIIGLLDHMGYGNLGDAAIQESVIANIQKRLPHARLVGFSLVPEDTMHRHGIPCYPLRWWYPKPEHAIEHPRSQWKSSLARLPLFYGSAKRVADLLREALFWIHSYRILRRLDLLVISGGGQLDDLWGGPWRLPYTVFKFSLLARLAGRKFYLLDIGVGRLRHPLSRFFARWVVRLADYRSFRDRESQARVRALGIESPTYAYPDPAYALEIETHLQRSGPRDTARPVVGLNPSGFCDPRLWPRKDNAIYRAYLAKIARFAAWLIDQGYDLRVFTTDISVDRYAIEDLKERLHARFQSSEQVSRVFRKPSESVQDVLHEMSECDFIVTSKYHGIIFSHLLRKPVISLSYHPKMDAAMQAAGQGHFSADLEHFQVDWLIAAFQQLTDESTRIRSALPELTEAYAAALHEQFESLFIQRRAAG